MQAITIHDGVLRYRDDLPEPTPADGEVLLDVIQAGICETDLQLARGYMAFSGILGHEFVGVARSGVFVGQRVVGEINCNCRQCPRCRAGLGNHCAHRTVVGIDRHDGAFAQCVAIPEHHLHPVPDSVSDDQAVLVEPLAAALQIGEQVELDRVSNACILGDGRLAFLIAQSLLDPDAGMAAGEVTVVGKHSSKLERFQQRGLATVELDQPAANQTLADKSMDLVVDATGSTSGLPLALRLVRPRGTVVMKTTVAAEHQLSLASIVIDEITLIGSRCGPFAKAIERLNRGTIDVSNLITHRYPLSAARQAMNKACDPEAFKVVFDVQGGMTGVQ